MAKIIAAVLITLSVGCDNRDNSLATIPSIEQGIWGRVEVWGDSSSEESDSQSFSGRISYARQRLFVFDKTHIDQLTPDPSRGSVFFKSIETSMVGTTRSDDRGYYEISLPIGEYSVFVEVAGRLYANHFDGEGFAEPAFVGQSEVVHRGIRIMPQPSDRAILVSP